jgi:hypothetical protein
MPLSGKAEELHEDDPKRIVARVGHTGPMTEWIVDHAMLAPT